MEEVIGLLEKLGELQDPRSAEIFINYFLKSGLWGKPMKEALIEIGPPSVPPLIPLLDADRLLGRLIGAKLLGIIGSENHHELGGVVEHIILPKLKKLVPSDSNPRVRRYASVAIARIIYGQQDNTVEIPRAGQARNYRDYRTASSPSMRQNRRQKMKKIHQHRGNQQTL